MPRTMASDVRSMRRVYAFRLRRARSPVDGGCLSTIHLSCAFPSHPAPSLPHPALVFARTFDRDEGFGRWSAVSSWVSVLEQLAELDPADFDLDDLADEQLRQFLPRAQIGINRLTAVQTAAVAAGAARQVQRADGMVSMKMWLTGHCRIPGRAAADLLRDGRRLAQLPALAAAYAEGAVTPVHVAAGTAAVTPARVAVAEANGIDLGTTDAVLTEAARALGPEDTAKAVRRWVAGIDPDGALDEAAGLPRIFRMAVSSHGRIYLSGHLDPVGGGTGHAALEAGVNGDPPARDPPAPR